MGRILGEEQFTSMPGLRPRGVVDPGNQSIGGALEGAGSTLYRLGAEREREANALELSKAKSLWLQAKVKADNAYKNDNDWKTIEERYSKDLDGAASVAADLISDDYTRALFEDSISVDAVQGRERAKALAFAKRADVELAGFSDSILHSREAFIAGDPDSRLRITEANEAHMQALLDEGIVDEQWVQSQRVEIGNSYLIGAIEASTPEKGLEILKHESAKHLPSDVRAKYKARLESELLVGKAQDQTDSIIGRYESSEERLKAARKISDPKLRDEVVRRVTNRTAEDKRLEVEQQTEIFDRVYKAIADGEGKVDDLTALERETLSASQYSSLLSIEAARAKGVEIETNWDVWTELELMDSVKDVNPIDYRGSLADTEYRALVKRVQTDRKPSDDLYTTSAVETLREKRNAALKELKVEPDSERGRAFMRQLQRTMSAFEIQKSEELGKSYKATPQEQDEIIASLMADSREPTFSEEWVPFVSVAPKVFEDALTPDEIRTLKGIPADEIYAIEQALRDNARPVSAESVRYFYEKANAR